MQFESYPPTTIFGFAFADLGKVDGIHKKGDWPILVGETPSFVNALLFNRPLIHFNKTKETALQHTLRSSNESLRALLNEVDPKEAARIPPWLPAAVKARVEMYLRTGRTPSDIFRELREAKGTRWPTLIFWVRSEREPLFDRLNKRVDDMVEQEIEQEVRQLYEMSERPDMPVNADIFSAIGFPRTLARVDRRLQRIFTLCAGREYR